jgi:ribosomal protein S18 acetylase RimI-like enzyme
MDNADHWLTHPATKSDVTLINPFLEKAEWVHQHLDWLAPEAFLGRVPFLLLSDQHKKLTACLACPLGPHHVAWIRIFAVTTDHVPQRIWERLWPEAVDELLAQGCERIAALVLSQWFDPLLIQSGFTETNAVIFLEWQEKHPLAQSEFPGVIRGLRPSDIEAVIDLDQRAFKSIWSNPRQELLEAIRQASISTVVELEGQVLGYQVSTTSTWGAHLARLAVDPGWQGKGIGYAIVADLIRQTSKRGYPRFTVNTQEDNLRSIRLYQRLGFVLTGDRYPVMELEL